ncbi:MAG: ATP-dependent DNA ligase [Sandaracinaceae bacterium]|nr:ATP-dependent DNA ligase [Sandaracinaceae bacterium]
MPFARFAALSGRVAGERGRNAKIARLADFLGSLRGRDVLVGASYCAGELPQGKVGVGYATIRAIASDAPPPPALGTLSLRELDQEIEALAALEGAGSAKRRKEILTGLLARATAQERDVLLALLVSELRQGALASLMLEAVAQLVGAPPARVRRAAMLAGSEVLAAHVALTEGALALERFVLTPFTPVLPMLASPCADPGEALEIHGEALFELKLDGARIQAHREGEVVRVWSRAMNEVTERVPEVVAAVRAMPATRAILDGEAIALRDDGSPAPFQVSMQRFGRTRGVEDKARSLPLTPFFFDVLLVDDTVLLDAPLSLRRAELVRLVGEGGLARVPRSVRTRDADEAERLYAEVVAAGHEGLVAKSLEGLYEAGHRGSAWLKIKPAHTLDLVVLAVERGSGRRTGTLSNIHLGARDPSANGGFAMVGKTFKGMTDAMLAWQTRRFAELARDPAMLADPSAWSLALRPEQVVEVALNGVQVSSEYASGVALRFARVRRYRDDKRAEDASTIDEVRALLPR